jgi:peptidoglycan/xylan/chitin deacetylase (PgdA/CDA1 family)
VIRARGLALPPGPRGGLGGRLRTSVLVVGGALGLACAASILAAAGVLRSPVVALALVLGAWSTLALAGAWLLWPGFDPLSFPRPGRTLARAPADPSGAPPVALTLDDGPHPDSTPAILDALAASSVHATFFLVGDNARRWPELARRIVEDGHAVGNHTQRHRLLAFRTADEVAEEIASCQATLGALGIVPTLFRPPHGFKPFGLHRALAPHRMRLCAWQGSLRDTDGPAADVLVTRALALAAPGRILLLHDSPTTRGSTAAALPAIIAAYRRRGFAFVTLG